MRVALLGISGVLHPGASLYELVYRRSLWDAGHRKYEAVPWLSSALAHWLDVRMVLLTYFQSNSGAGRQQ